MGGEVIPPFVFGGKSVQTQCPYGEGVYTVQPSGRIDAATAPELGKALQGLLAAGQTCLIVNLDAVRYLSSGALRVLLVTIKEARRLGGDVKLCCLQPNVYRVFKLSGFTQIFEIHDTEETAARAFQGQPATRAFLEEQGR
jgi:anti-anti-sigma factor